MADRPENEFFARMLDGLLRPGAIIDKVTKLQDISARSVSPIGRKGRGVVENPQVTGMLTRLVVSEQLSSQTLSVCWSDSRTGHHSDQVWRFGIAHAEAYCSISGAKIKRGDTIVRPFGVKTFASTSKPIMVLASMLPTTEFRTP